jgi:uncharacterized membrane protein
MNKEEFDINQELEQMRQDYADLKERFDQQQIINEQLMEKAFKADVRWLSRDRNSGVIAVILGIPAIIILSIIRKADWWFPVVATVFVLIILWAMLRLYKNLSKDTLYTEDVLSATKKVKRFKQQYQRYFFASLAAAVILFGSYLPTIYHSWSTPEQGTKMVVIGCIFAVVLLVWGYVYYKRLMKACDSILDRLENVPRNS